jgi:hypothetical protein
MITIDFIKENDLLLFEVISGSNAFGLATEKSDLDIKGVFYLPKEIFFGTEYIPQVSNETNDIVYYELGRFIELLLKNNPNILEILATPNECVLYKHPIMDLIIIDDFLSKLCKETFGGYAMTQIYKARGLNKKIVNPMPKERKGIIDFCVILNNSQSISLKKWLVDNNYFQEKCGLVKIPNTKGVFGLYYDEIGNKNYRGIYKNEFSNEVNLSSISKESDLVAYLFFYQDAYSTYCKQYKEYWDWVAKRNNDRFETNQKHGKNYDSKNMMHTIGLLQSAIHIFKKNELIIKVENRDELLSIKNGLKEYEELITYAENLLIELTTYFEKSFLPDSPDSVKIEKILVDMRTELYGY